MLRSDIGAGAAGLDTADTETAIRTAAPDRKNIGNPDIAVADIAAPGIGQAAGIAAGIGTADTAGIAAGIEALDTEVVNNQTAAGMPGTTAAGMPDTTAAESADMAGLDIGLSMSEVDTSAEPVDPAEIGVAARMADVAAEDIADSELQAAFDSADLETAATKPIPRVRPIAGFVLRNGYRRSYCGTRPLRLLINLLCLSII